MEQVLSQQVKLRGECLEQKFKININMQIASAILERSFKSIKHKLDLSCRFVDFCQIDICDGKFVPSKTFCSNKRKDSIKKLAKLARGRKIELDLMVENPEDWAEAVRQIGPFSAVLHIEKDGGFIEEFKKISQVSFAVHLDWNEKKLVELAKKHKIKNFQVMGIERVGFGGQKFSKKALQKIKSIKSLMPSAKISVDGGVKIENAKALKEAGADILVSGSGIFKHPEGVKVAVLRFREESR